MRKTDIYTENLFPDTSCLTGTTRFFAKFKYKKVFSSDYGASLNRFRKSYIDFGKEISALVLCPNFATYAVYLHYMWLSQ